MVSGGGGGVPGGGAEGVQHDSGGESVGCLPWVTGSSWLLLASFPGCIMSGDKQRPSW